MAAPSEPEVPYSLIGRMLLLLFTTDKSLDRSRWLSQQTQGKVCVGITAYDFCSFLARTNIGTPSIIPISILFLSLQSMITGMLMFLSHQIHSDDCRLLAQEVPNISGWMLNS